MNTLYFAYGSNISKKGMRHRCPGSKAIGTAILPDYRLTFRGVADVEPSLGDLVMGALWKCPPQDIASLDRYEGVRGGFYRKEVLTVQAEDGPVEALVYIMCPTLLDNQSLPSQGYFNTIRDGYIDFGLPFPSLSEALRVTKERVVGHKGITEFVPHGPKRMGPAGTQRPTPKKAKPKKSKRKAQQRVPQGAQFGANTTRSGRAMRPLPTAGMSPATRREMEMEREWELHRDIALAAGTRVA